MMNPEKTLVFIICLKFLRILWYLLIYYANNDNNYDFTKNNLHDY